MATKSAAKVKMELRSMIKGLVASFDAKAPFNMGGRIYKRDEIVAQLQSVIDAMEAVEPIEVALKAARARRTATARTVKPVQRSLDLFLRALYGAESLKLATFGLTPQKPRKVTVETKVKAAEKGRATREARGTLGKKQRLKIKGTVG